MLILYRLISRAVLVCFKEVCPRTSEKQDDYDIMLDEAMELVPAAAGEIIALGKTLVVKRDEFIRKSFRAISTTRGHTSCTAFLWLGNFCCPRGLYINLA